jgi:uncharacterized protein
VIIDSHVHAGEYGRHFSAGFAREMMATTGMPPEVLSAPESRLLAAMDEAGVDQAFLLAFDVQRVAGFKVPNELVAGMCERHPSRFTGFASVDAGTPGAAEEVRRAVTELGLRGLKTAPAYLRMSPADRRWYEVYQAATELSIPVLVHTGYTPARSAAPRFFSPRLLEPVAADFPGMRVILAHLGTPWTDDALAMLASHPQLFADLSIFGWYQPIEAVAAALCRARQLGVADRLLWGTDFPFCTMTEFAARMTRLASDETIWPDERPLTESEYRSIMGQAAATAMSGALTGNPRGTGGGGGA